MKLYLTLFTTLLLSNSPAVNATEVGMYTDTFKPTHRHESVNFFIWYPAENDGELTQYGDSPIMYGKPARKNATPQKGKFPLVILSHGGGGNAGQLGWLTEPLVKAGYAVIAPNHPGSTTGNASAKGILSLWQRPQDISQLLDLLTVQEAFSKHIDLNNITSLGFSAGGYTVLNLAGARADTTKLRHYCDDNNKGQMTKNFCQFLFRTGGKDIFQQIDWQPAAKNYYEKRIHRVIAVDPGVSDALDMNSFDKVPETLLINLGTKDIEPVVDAKPIHQKIPHSVYKPVTDANHFSFLAICKPQAKAILAEEGEPEPLCDLPEGAKRSREQVHQELVNMILEFLKHQ